MTSLNKVNTQKDTYMYKTSTHFTHGQNTEQEISDIYLSYCS
jgi:hypothetical protein